MPKINVMSQSDGEIKIPQRLFLTFHNLKVCPRSLALATLVQRLSGSTVLSGHMGTEKSARTRAENAEREQQDLAHMIKSLAGRCRTSSVPVFSLNLDLGGRAAKCKALENAGEL